MQIICKNYFVYDIYKYMNTVKRKIIFDIDTGIDDCLAILMGLYSKLDILFFASCQGNTTAINGAINTLNVLNYVNAKNIPVAIGSESGFVKNRKKVANTSYIHGANGLGDYEFPPHTRKPLKENAILKYIEILENTKNKIDILVLGPITNLASVLKLKPHLKEKIGQVFFMASSTEKIPENKTPYAGFNIACDPEAAEFVFSLGLDIILCPNQMGKLCTLKNEELDLMKNTNQLGTTLYEILEKYHDRQITNGKPCYDSATIFAYCYPKHTKITPVNVQIKYYDDINTGVAIADFDKPANMKMITNIDVDMFKKIFFETINFYN